jgi:protein TonB
MSVALHFPSVRTSVLPPTPRRALVGVVIAVHAALAYGLLQLRSARGDAPAPAPLFVSLLTPQVAQETPPPLARAAKALPLPSAPEAPVPEVPRVISAAPAVVAAPPDPAASPAPTEAAAPQAVAIAAPKLIPPSAVQYIEPPVLVYPRASRRAGEAGRVVLRVLIDEHGQPRQALVNHSSGFARLDEAAIAAVLKARFRPYSDNGQPLAGWALVPLSFDLQA